jgi:L-threonylcarbamoyladenylate synthase
LKTEIFQITDPERDGDVIRRAGDTIRSGGLVVFPTETVYGIGGDGTSATAAGAIYAAKGRPSDNPLIIHIAAPEDAEAYAITNPTYYRLAKHFMPGPLTVILPKKDTVPSEVTGGLATVAIRCPAHPVANALIRAAAVPIAAPSANTSGKPSPTLASHVIEDLNGKVDMILDGGECEVGLESTIVALNGEDGVLLRPGAITFDALSCVCRRVTVAPAVTEMLKENEKPQSPGMKYRHYAPDATLILLNGDCKRVLSFMQAEATKPTVGIICYEEELALFPQNATVLSIGKQQDLKTQAHCLFSVLRHMNDYPELKTVYAHLPPQNGLGLALYNRLIRAAAHTVKTL